RGSESPDDCAFRYLKLEGEGIDQEHQNEKVEGIQRPTQETGGDCVPLIAARHPPRGICAGSHGVVWSDGHQNTISAGDAMRSKIALNQGVHSSPPPG